ncbi:hypothetical protein MPSEU_000812900 [Mayamaea pseudoterrestris]|nr:hypothetical protein MPSEU_000812900 [Mayamaea pseudoterrestris]
MMSSILLSIFTRFTQRAGSTPVAPTSWAVACLWNKFFALQDEEQEQHLATIAQALEEAQAETSPIGTDAAVQERKMMMREFYLPLMAMRRGNKGGASISNPPVETTISTASPLLDLIANRQAEQLERVVSNQINLNVPREDGDYMYYAQ